MPVEKELKYHLDGKSYQKILKASRTLRGKTEEQSNFYFDTKALSLRKKRVSLRIRVYPRIKKAQLTLKSSILKAYIPLIGFKAQNEFEISIAYPLAQKVCKNRPPIGTVDKKPVQLLHRKFPEKIISRIKCLGCLKTTRTKFKLDSSIAELDRSRFFGKVFYELEVETTRPISVDKRVFHH